MTSALTPSLGADSLGLQVISLLQRSLADNSYSSYGSHLRKYFTFCDEQGLDPFSSTEAIIARYIAWLGQQGTVGAASLQPYLSAINRYLEDHGLPGVAKGLLIAKTRKGLALTQVDTRPRPRRVALPAEVALRILQHASLLQLQPGVWHASRAPPLGSSASLACLSGCRHVLLVSWTRPDGCQLPDW